MGQHISEQQFNPVQQVCNVDVIVVISGSLQFSFP